MRLPALLLLVGCGLGASASPTLTIKDISHKPESDNDTNVVYTVTWDYNEEENEETKATNFEVSACPKGSETCVVVDRDIKLREANVTLEYYTDYTITVVANHVESDNKKEVARSEPETIVTYAGSPDPVTELKALQQEQQEDILHVTWGPPAFTRGVLDFFQVNVTAEDRSFTNTTKVNSTILELDVKIEQLKMNKKYRVQVTAFNANNTDGNSAEVNITLTGPRFTIDGISNVPEKNTDINVTYTVTWDYVKIKDDEEKPTSFDVKACPVPSDGDDSPVVCVNATGNGEFGPQQASLTLEYSTNYTVSVSAIYEKPENVDTVSDKLETLTGIPDAVSKFKATQQPSTNVIHLSWKGPKFTRGLLAFYTIIVQADDGSYTWTGTAETNPEKTDVTITKVKTDVNYTIEIVPVNIGDISGDGTSCTVMLNPPRQPIVKVAKRDTTSIEFEITEPTGKTLFYQVKNPTTNETHTQGSVNLEFHDLTTYTKVELQVSACFGTGEDTLCGEALNITDYTNVDKPSEVVGLALGFTSGDLKLSWEAPTTKNGPVEYQVTTTVKGAKDAKPITVPVGNETTFVHDAAVDGERYHYSVQAYNRDLNNGSLLLSPPTSKDTTELCIETAGALPFGFKYAQLKPTENLIGWKWTDFCEKRNSQVESFSVKINGNEVIKSTKDKKVTLDQLQPGKKLDVEITANFNENTKLPPALLKTGMLTLQNDYATPTDLKVEKYFIGNNDTKVTYLAKWKYEADRNAVGSPVTFTVLAQSSDGPTFMNSSTEREAELVLNYSTKYNVTVTAALQLPFDQTITKTSSMNTFTSFTGTPGPIGDLSAVQDELKNLVTVKWTPPTVTRGKLDHYKIDVSNENINGTTTIVNGAETNTTISIANAKGSVQYRITVAAVNIAIEENNEEQVGDETSTSIDFKGPASPKVDVKERLSDSVMLRVTEPINPNLFYRVDGKGKFESENITVSNLKVSAPFSIMVSTCFGENEFTVCSDGTQLNDTTNVGNPDKVEGLTLKVEKDVPSLSWKVPKETRGKLAGYQVDISEAESKDKKIIKSDKTTVTKYTHKPSDKGKRYKYVVKAYNLDIDTNKEVYGAPASVETEKGGFPAWAIVLIVLILLAAAGGGAFYYFKMRR